MSDQDKERLSIGRIVRSWARETGRDEKSLREDLFTAAIEGQFAFPMSPSDDSLRRFGPYQSHITSADGNVTEAGHLKNGLEAMSSGGSNNHAVWARAEDDVYISRDGFRQWCSEHGEALPQFWFVDAQPPIAPPDAGRTGEPSTDVEMYRAHITSDEAASETVAEIETRRDKGKRETEEKHNRWYELAKEIKQEGMWTRPRDIARAIEKRQAGVKGARAENIRRRLDEHYPGWSAAEEAPT